MSQGEECLSRRDVLRTGALAVAGTVGGMLFSKTARAQEKIGSTIDVHGHLWTNDYLDLMDKYGKKDTWVQRNKGAGISEDEIQKRFAMMDSVGIGIQALSICPQAPHFENKEHAVTAAKKANDLYVEAVQKWPKRFLAYVALPLPHVDESLKEIERMLGQKGFVGATIATSIMNRSIADPAFLPVYEELNRRKTVLFIHPGGYGAYTPLISDYHITWMIGAPVEDTIAVVHLITHGIPKKYPDLQIINTHMGGALPMLVQRLDNQYTWENPATPEKPSIAMRRMWYDTVGHGYDPALKAAVDSIGADRLVFGTDFPYEPGQMFKRAADYIHEVGLKQEQVDAILHGNPARLLNVS
ncbi:MAG TPA: amidohydrolase family protein, partial [Bryobacteraceae bacterium]|nr:amidohydrolase family protein [Bryobacteraceae bacterium]